MEIKEAKSFKDRLIGLMFKKNINYGLIFNNCRAIHTFFMRETIDVIITDKDNKVLYIYNDLKKNKIIIKKNAYYFYELPSSFNTYKINDTLKIQD